MIRSTKKWGFTIYCFSIAAIFLLICSKSSPLYPMNDWVDVNCFFTIGKSLLDGLLPYRDLYEQKGPVLYFIYAIVALFSRKTYFFVYLLEVLTYGLFLFYSGKILKLYLRDNLLISLLVAIEGGLIVVSRAFAHGASVEEMCLFMSAYALFVTLRAMKENRVLSFREALICGIWAGFLLWIKYTMLGLYLGLAVFILIWYIGWGQKWRELFRTIGAFFIGLGAVSASVFLYFAANGAIGDLFTVYFYNNIFLYAKDPATSRLETIWTCLRSTVKFNHVYTYLFIPGALWALWMARKDIKIPLLIVLCASGLAFGTYWGGWAISYYGLVFAVFSVFGFVAIGTVADKIKLLSVFHASAFTKYALALIGVLSMTICCLTNGQNLYLIGKSRESMPQYRFAEIINEVDNATLLNFGFLDGGFYYAADVTPSCHFFCTLNVQAPDMWATQYASVEQAKTDFVVTRDRPLEDYHVDSSRYECVSTAEQYFEGKLRTYYLYRAIF